MKVSNKSDSEIREKIFKLSGGKAGTAPAGFDRAAKPMPGPEIKKAVEGKELGPAAKADIKTKGKPGKAAAKKDHLLKSDVSANNPADPVTQEKLKSILKSGSFSFNDKERKALGSILNK